MCESFFYDSKYALANPLATCKQPHVSYVRCDLIDDTECDLIDDTECDLIDDTECNLSTRHAFTTTINKWLYEPVILGGNIQFKICEQCGECGEVSECSECDESDEYE